MNYLPWHVRIADARTPGGECHIRLGGKYQGRCRSRRAELGWQVGTSLTMDCVLLLLPTVVRC